MINKDEIQSNWGAALESVNDGAMLSSAIGYGFSKADLRELLALHQAGKYQQKIEELLVDCNFISFCCCLISHNYDEAIEVEGLNEPD
ncbi:hypothetical protein SELR_12220 [Selenomonas ruminantium subsp. lactilytica TAM6421]|uniref:Uncharacterized protein n=1 Tax=Selenomonas ruminantium subsp. lactilytica (strain NBRC 103574 / TAM6421) TaxID=927704 RepID=I0GQ93_SELRL|nr:hypothetical protein [Selenomonas ruminantium]BAL82930.1 hypothetical protein SELR_12220 [Selenomonas ruminantium subsp. lactilytica TAM6421]